MVRNSDKCSRCNHTSESHVKDNQEYGKCLKCNCTKFKG